ncbi:unnamed protein product [Bursaphelenchus xylophilus]|uniref:(pine wood nematode) hypothetical protein n=1 Tax=Bursaphelenchus xylophilus TaxID=6326 RepID=A0A1I7S197_BURXY|nr:unnamed protein product [Bursaphelenchus xylophilus]CAG9080164.1 unnamed protein product [Bursaphelenchus xylophilus]
MPSRRLIGSILLTLVILASAEEEGYNCRYCRRLVERRNIVTMKEREKGINREIKLAEYEDALNYCHVRNQDCNRIQDVFNAMVDANSHGAIINSKIYCKTICHIKETVRSIPNIY